MLTARALAIAAAILIAAGGAEATGPPSFHLVFDGRHNASLLHEGAFATSSSLCATGVAGDLSVDATTDTAVRRFTCATGGEFTAKVTPLPAEHGGIGSWQIVDGTGPLANLRGKGTFTSTRLSGRPDDPATITFRSTWEGVADFDVAPPHVAVMSSTVRKLKRPKGAYDIRLALSITDAGSDLVSYVLQIVAKKPRSALVYRVGQTTTGTVTQTLRLKPAKTVRTVQLEVDATDAVGNEAALTKTIRLK
jgi:hypothetical protein